MTVIRQGRFQRQTISYAVALLLAASSATALAANSDDVKSFSKQIHQQVPQLLGDHMVPGSAVALIKNGQVVMQQGFGFADVDGKVPVDLNTGFNIGSISKSVAAWGVMKLVEQGKVDLDAPVQKYLKRWQLPKTEFDNNQVTVRRLLSHTAGLSLHGYPGWGPHDTLPSVEQSLNGKNNGPGDVRLIMKPNTKWKYSGGGYTISQLLVEEVSGLSFNQYMTEQVFKPLAMHDSSYELNAKLLKTSAIGYDNFTDKTAPLYFTAKAAASLQTTIVDLAKFVSANLPAKSHQLGQGVLKSTTLNAMHTAQSTLEPTWGLGFSSKAISNELTMVGHGGANRGWRASISFIPQSGDGLIVLTNSSNGGVIGRVIDCQWQKWLKINKDDQSCTAKAPIQIAMIKTYKKKDIDAAIAQYHRLKKSQPDKYSFSEQQLNSLGYALVNQNKLADAIKIFALNVNMFPQQANTYDSLAEAYMLDGQNKLAIKHYQQVQQLEPEHANASNMLSKLKGKR